MGLFFAAFGGWKIWSTSEFASGGSSATGRVVNFEQGQVRSSNRRRYRTVYRPIVEFRDQNGAQHTFVSKVGNNPRAYSRGERVNVIYDQWSPDEAIIDDFNSRYKVPAWFIGFGLLFSSIGAVLVYFFLRRQRLNAQLRANGMLIHAQYVNSSQNRRIKVSGRSPYVVTVRGKHPSTGQSMAFESEPIWKDLSPVLLGKTVPVRVDPSNPKHYLVDLSQWVSEDEFA